MPARMYKERDSIACRHCISGEETRLFFADGVLTGMAKEEGSEGDLPFVGPGLIDLQVNGVKGIDFNNPALSREEVAAAAYFLLGQGITSFFPTVITNSDENICRIVRTISGACASDAVVNDCIRGIHLEGPFLSAVPGAKGAHDEAYIKAPDWSLFQTYQQAAGGKIKIITLAPEWEGACAFIENAGKKRCWCQSGILWPMRKKLSGL